MSDPAPPAADPDSPDPTRRRGNRRASILMVAAELFAEAGYPAVGMDQIGAAAGITGPAIYRHFASKAAVLVAVFDGIIDAVSADPQQPLTDEQAGRLTPAAARDRLFGLISVYAAAVASRRRLMAVWVREVLHLPAEHRDGLDDRQRAVVRQWRLLLARVHPDWPRERIRAAVHTTFGMLNAVGTFDTPLSDADLATELRALATRALDLPDPT